jgi:hypothetical protein
VPHAFAKCVPAKFVAPLYPFFPSRVTPFGRSLKFVRSTPVICTPFAIFLAKTLLVVTSIPSSVVAKDTFVSLRPSRFGGFQYRSRDLDLIIAKNI